MRNSRDRGFKCRANSNFQPARAMSETLNSPWIADYLINTAETYGCNLSNIPVHVKPGRKVQLLQVSTIMRRGVQKPARFLIDHLSFSLFNNTLGMTVSGPMSLTSTSSYPCDSLGRH